MKRAAISAVTVALASACAGKATDGDSGLPPGCADVLGQPVAHSVDCLPSARCAQVRSEPAKEYEFTVAFDPTASQKAGQCLADFLNGRGARAKVESWNGLSVTGSFQALEPALSYTIVTSYNVLGCAGGCTYCATLPTEQCASDAFCAVITGRPFDAANQCLQGVQNVGCQEATIGCIPEPQAVLDSEGMCWEVDCGGVPDGWSATGNQFCYASVGFAPACP